MHHYCSALATPLIFMSAIKKRIEKIRVKITRAGAIKNVTTTINTWVLIGTNAVKLGTEKRNKREWCNNYPSISYSPKLTLVLLTLLF